MKRLALILGGLLMVGCAHDNKQICPTCESGQPAPTAPATPFVATPAAPAAPAAPAVVAKPSPIFEMTKDNKIYVFASVQAMTDFSAGKAQPTVVEKPNFTPGGRTLVLEAADATEADSIFASYNKLHPVAK